LTQIGFRPKSQISPEADYGSPHNHARGQAKKIKAARKIKAKSGECREFYSSNLVRLTAQLFKHPVALGQKIRRNQMEKSASSRHAPLALK